MKCYIKCVGEALRGSYASMASSSPLTSPTRPRGYNRIKALYRRNLRREGVAPSSSVTYMRIMSQ